MTGKLMIGGVEYPVHGVRVVMTRDDELQHARNWIMWALKQRLGDKMPTPKDVHAALLDIMREPDLGVEISVAVDSRTGELNITMPEGLALELRRRMLADHSEVGHEVKGDGDGARS